MNQAKEKMQEIIGAQPDDATYDELLRELAFARMIERGLDDFAQGRVISHEEMRRRVSSWRTI